MAIRIQSKPQVLPLEDRCVPAVLTGVVYADINGDGTRDLSEPGIGGVTVQFDVGSTGGVDKTTTTDADGKYTFNDVPAGKSTINVMPSLGTSVVGTTTSVISVTATDTAITAPAIGLRTNGRVTGTIFTDLNGNAKQDANEPGYVGAVVSLDLGHDGTTDYTTTSGDKGEFTFSNLPDGVHTLAVTAPLNTKVTTESTATISITNGGIAPAFNVGVQPTSGVTGKVTLGGAVGTIGVAGVTVGLDTTGDGKADVTTLTNADGIYLFTAVPPGTQTVLITAPVGSRYSTADGTNKLAVTVASATPGNPVIVTAADIGVTYPGSVVGTVYLDLNANGKQDADERGMAPGSVQIDLNGSGKLVTMTAAQQADGTFRVEGVPDGSHFLVVNPSGSFSSGSFSRIPFTVTNGSSATVVAIGVRGNGGGTGSTLTIGDGSGPGTKAYTFTPGPDGTLTPTATQTLTTPSAGRGGTRVLMADFNGDGADDTVTATGGGETAMIHIYDGKTGAEIVPGGIVAFEGTFSGGVNLAAGDFNGDGKADIVAAADVGGGPRVRLFNAAQFQAGADPAQGKLFADFFAIDDRKFRGGARVTVGDLNGDGTPDLVVAAGVGGGPRVALYDGKSLMPGNAPRKITGDFFAYEPGLRNGATVSVGDVNGDGKLDLITGAGPGGAPRVTVFSGAGILAGQGAASTRIADFFVNGETNSRAGTNITVKDLDRDGRADVIATDAGRAYVFTSKGISNNFLNPRPNGPAAAASIDGFTDSTGINVG